MQLLAAPIATAEFMVVDTETNGLSGEDCELTEVGAVLVGGGELHDRWSSLCRTSAPLRRGMQRLTGITQAMVDGAPSLETVLPPVGELLKGRVMVAHNAPFDRRVLRQAFHRIGLEWPDPPVLCTAAMARSMLPLQRRRGLTVLADALGIEVHTAHRALADAETCARVLCALFPRLCANVATVSDAIALLSPRRRARRRPPAPGSLLAPAPGHPIPRMPTAPRRGAPAPNFTELPRDPGVYLFRDDSGRVLYIGKSVSIRSRARAHFAPSSPPAAWTTHATVVDYRTTGSELGRARVGEPADQGAQAAGQQTAGAPRRPARLHPLPAGHPVSNPGGRPRSRGRARRYSGAGPRTAAGAGAGGAARLTVRAAPLRPPPAPS